MGSQLQAKKIAFLVAQEGVEEVELTEPCAKIVEEFCEGRHEVASAGATAGSRA
jgi:hypothetical protein